MRDAAAAVALRKPALLVSGVGRYRGSIGQLPATEPICIVRLAVFMLHSPALASITPHLPRSIGCRHGSKMVDDRSKKATLHTSATANA